ncbi:DUF6615 family protein [Kitasatospora purpeofusca]|uniref:DUF6615 family protein n=1 Tax=Kitasatospora purpeofusca TaxID=67352 RepID=UPI0035D9C10E
MADRIIGREMGMSACGICDHETAKLDNYCGHCGAQQIQHGGDGRPGVPLADSLCRTLRACATRTFERLAVDHYDTPEARVPREETYTSLNLQDLRRRHGDRVAIVEFSPHEETRNGADWEWWFHANGEGFGMRLQAKRAMRGGGYRLEHKTRSGLQSELLVQDALATGCVPAYVLYNHRNWVPAFADGRPEACVHGPGLTSHMGCTIVSALTVHAVLRNRGNAPAKVRDASIPWHWVLCGERRGQSNLRAAHQEVQRLHHRGLDALTEALRGGSERPEAPYSPMPPSRPAGQPDPKVGSGNSSRGPGWDEVREEEDLQPPPFASSVEERWLTPAERAAHEAAENARVQQILEGPPYCGVQDLVDAPASRLPQRVLDMIRYREAGEAPDERAVGAVLVDLSPHLAEK